MVPNGFYLHIDDFSELGKAYIHDHNPKEKFSIIRPVFKIEKEGIQEKIYNFIPGWLTESDNCFFKCPLILFHIQVNSANYRDSAILEIDFKVFNKQRSKHIKATLKINRYNKDFRSMSEIFNLINLFVESGRDIEMIDFNQFSKLDFSLKDKSIILSAVDNLKFEFFDNSSNRVGKENFFWIESEISNLPSDNYLTQLIIENLSKQYSVEKTDYGLFIKSDIETAYLPSHGRIKNDESLALEKKVKDLLKLDMAIEYVPLEQLLSQLIIK